MSKEQDVKFLESYRRDVIKFYHIAAELTPCDFVTPEDILSNIPSKKKLELKLATYAKHLAEQAQTVRSRLKAKRLERYSNRLSEPNVRSKRAELLFARETRVALHRIECITKSDKDAMRAAQLANENGLDGSVFLKYYDDPTSIQSMGNIRRQIELIPLVISIIEAPEDRSIIPDGTELLSVAQVAGMLGWGESVVRQRHNEGKLPMPLRFGITMQWRKKELNAWLDAECPSRQEWQLKKQNEGV